MNKLHKQTKVTLYLLLIVASLTLLVSCHASTASASTGDKTTRLQPTHELWSGRYLIGFVHEIENDDQHCIVVITNGREATTMSCVEKPQ